MKTTKKIRIHGINYIIKMKSKFKNIFNTNYGNPKIKYLTLNINYFNEHKFLLNQKLN